MQNKISASQVVTLPISLPAPERTFSRQAGREPPRRYFIVTHGRSGSSFLADILETCGADFGPDCAGDRDSERDHWESRRIERAVRYAHNANLHFSPAMAGSARMAYRYWRSRAKGPLAAGLRDAVWSKNRSNAVILPLAERLGYRPVVIVSYRNPAEVVLSDIRQLKNMPSAFMPSITKTYLDARYALERYGGVLVDHAQLMDNGNDDWAVAIAAVTGLDAQALLATRDQKLKRRHPGNEADGIWLPPDLKAVADQLRRLRNVPLPGARFDREHR